MFLCPDGSFAEYSGIAQLLDEHHLVVLGEDQETRRIFADALVEQVIAVDGTEVLRLDGGTITSLPTFAGAFARARGLVPRPIKDVDSFITRLRDWTSSARMRYIVWDDADQLLEADVSLFGQLANALLGVSAEREFVSSDRLVIQRVVFVGDNKLGAYAEEERGQLRSWHFADGSTPFWEVAACLTRPPVLTYRLDG
jgi:hypothetical protein